MTSSVLRRTVSSSRHSGSQSAEKDEAGTQPEITTNAESSVLTPSLQT